jgi:hypothetical protein
MTARRSSWTGTLVGVALAALIAPARAQHHGHQITGPAGPQGLRFETTCRGTVAGLIDRGVQQLHDFEFDSAAANFRLAAHSDIDCTTAYWGAAMAHWGRFAATGRSDVLAEGWRALDTADMLARPPSPREHAYLRAVRTRYRDRLGDGARRYSDAMAALAGDFPTDPHAALFAALARLEQPALSLRAAEGAGRAALGLLRQPSLPGNDLRASHYAVLAGDQPALAAEVVAQARTLAAGSGTSAYLQQVPALTFERLGLWDEAIAAGQRAADTARANGAGAEELRVLEPLVYALLQATRVDEARAVVRRLDAGYLAGTPDADQAGVRTRISVRVALETDDMATAIALPIADNASTSAAVPVLFARALAAGRLARPAEARAASTLLADVAARDHAAGVIAMVGAARAWAAFADGRIADAVAGLRAAADDEDAAALRAPWRTPILPAREQLADLLMAARRPADAAEAYRQTLRRWPGRARAERQLANAAGAASAAGSK